MDACYTCGAISGIKSQCTICKHVFCVGCQSECQSFLGRVTMCVPCSVEFHHKHKLEHDNAIVYVDGQCKHCHICSCVICETCSITCCNIKRNIDESDACLYCEACFRIHHICRLCKVSIPLGQCNRCPICFEVKEYKRVCTSCVTNQCDMCGYACIECYTQYHKVCDICTQFKRHPAEYKICNATIVHDIHLNTACSVCEQIAMCTSVYLRCSNIDCCQTQSYHLCVLCTNNYTELLRRRCDGCNSVMITYEAKLE